MNRKVKTKVKGQRAVDGAGVSLVRVLGANTIREFDPVLMLDSFDSKDPDDYIAGFPLHPHRGIETISYISRGNMVHKDTLGNEDEISDGEVQWMNAGSGIQHEEKLPAADRLLGVQLWLNLPKDEKMSKPYYKAIKNEEIKEVDLEDGRLRLLAGSYKDYEGFKPDHLEVDYYDIQLNKDGIFSLETKDDDSIMVFTLLGDISIEGEDIGEKTAVKLTEGDKLSIKAKSDAQILYFRSRALKEPVAWAGPIVMNDEAGIRQAFSDLRTGNFIKEDIEFND